MAGPHEFAEIFLDDVVVPRDCLLGEKNHGWTVATVGLTFERVGVARYARAGYVIEQLARYVREAGLAGDADVRQKLADLRVRYEAARLLSYRAISLQAGQSREAREPGEAQEVQAELAAGEAAGVAASIARLHNTQLEQLVGHVGLEILGLGGQLTHDDPQAPLGGLLWRQWVRNIPTTIAAGTLEIQKNIIARRGLGLPREGRAGEDDR
jgi:alkylation response protein AidB-like acyl-CoA dehydrogenase